MQRVELEAESRDTSGKGVARQLRRTGRIPGVLYGEGKSARLSLRLADVVKILKTESGENALINLKIRTAKGEETRTAIFRDLQHDPVTDQVLHADLFEISMTRMLRVKVPIEISGSQPLGVKEGGLLHLNLRELEIECLPDRIPDHIFVDASSLEIGDSIHVSELSVAEGIRVLEDPELAVVTLSAPMSEEKLEKILAGTPATEVKEPEVIGKAKEELEAAEGKDAKPAGGKESKPAAEAAAKPAAKKEEKK